MPRRTVLACLVLALATPALAETSEPAAPGEAPASAPAAPAVVERTPLGEKSHWQDTELARRYPAEVQWLEFRKERSVALWKPANVGTPRGTVILLPGSGEHADWPRSLGPLRRHLADLGWNTLSLNLPDPSPEPLPDPAFGKRGTAPVEPVETPAEEPAETPEPVPETEGPEVPEPPPAEPEPEPEPEPPPVEEPAQPSEPVEAVEEPPAEAPAEPPAPPPSEAERVTGRIEAALDFVAAKNAGPTMLLGQETGGYWALRFVSDNPNTSIARLALVAPRPVPSEPGTLAGMVGTLQVPIGDFHYPDQSAAAKARQDAAKRAKHPAFHSVRLPPPGGDQASDAQRLGKRVRAWFERELAN